MSDITVAAKFLKPFYKFTLKQLSSAELSSENEWVIQTSADSVLRCHMVWVQGTVTSVSGDTLLLSDSSGAVVTVESISSSPVGAAQAKTGQYLQVIVTY